MGTLAFVSSLQDTKALRRERAALRKKLRFDAKTGNSMHAGGRQELETDLADIEAELGFRRLHK